MEIEIAEVTDRGEEEQACRVEWVVASVTWLVTEGQQQE